MLVISYVPTWLKYSYLLELLVSDSEIHIGYVINDVFLVYCKQEALIADISYLFDEGTLIDFEVDELVGLVHALFADMHL